MALDLSACPWIVDRQQLVPAGPSWSVHVDDHQLAGSRLDPQSGQVSRWQPSPTLGCQGSQGFIISISLLIGSCSESKEHKDVSVQNVYKMNMLLERPLEPNLEIRLQKMSQCMNFKTGNYRNSEFYEHFIQHNIIFDPELF